MLDSGLREQLRAVFAPIEKDIVLVYEQCDHSDQSALLELLEGVASTSSKITVQLSGSSVKAKTPSFRLEVGGKRTGISFTGIPGGHEFSSLILAILNSDGKGKLPEGQSIARIRALKGPIHIKTYISLTCENCPDVVQMMNQIVLIHGNSENLSHEMIDGAYAQEDIANLGIQGVPSVVVGSRLIHSGRIQFLDLLSKLEEELGSEPAATQMIEQDLGQFDVVVIGGGPAGASAAIYSARKGLKTALLAERMGGQVQDTRGIENLISVLYTEGRELAARLREHVANYPIQILEQRRVQGVIQSDLWRIEIEGGEFLRSKSIIVATGAKWRELGIPGEKEYIGRGVAFCPHCDGPYYQGKKVAVVGGGNSGVEAAIDLAGIVREVVLFEFQDQLKADQVLVQKLKSLSNVTVILNAKTQKIVGDGQKVIGIEYEDRQFQKQMKLDLDGVFVQIGLLPNSRFLNGVVEMTRFGEIIVDEKGRTSARGIYAAGDVTTTPYKQIIIAMGEGAKVALTAFEDRMYESSQVEPVR